MSGSFIVVNKIREVLLNTPENISVNDLREIIEDVLSKYDELYRLFKWREEIILEGDNLAKYDDEFKRIEKQLIEEGFYISDDFIDEEIRKYINNLQLDNG